VIGGLVGNILLRQVPKLLMAQVQSGNLRVYGSVIRDPSNGRIQGFLQPSRAPIDFSAMADVAKIGGAVASLFTPYTAPVGAAYIAGKAGYALFDTQRTAHRIEAGVGRVEAGIGRIEKKLDFMAGGITNLQDGLDGLSSLALQNMALNIANMGIAVAGFDAMLNQLDTIRTAIHGLSGQVDVAIGKIDAVQHDLIEADFSELKSLAKAHDEGWLLSDASAGGRWQEVAHGALRYQTRFESRAERLLASNPGNYMLADPMLDAVGFASGLRVAALSACNEANAAREAAADGARAIERLTGSIGLADLTRRALASSGAVPGTQDWTIALAAANEGAREVVAKIRQRETAAVTRAAPLASLERRGIRPRDWLEAAREEKEVPVLVMLEDGLDKDA
jgi:hypothetical protein